MNRTKDLSNMEYAKQNREIQRMQTLKSSGSRDIGLDITRIVAFASVPSVHFFLNSGYYNTPVLGGRMYVMTIVRTFFMICVPLFMLLSGYLMVNKQIPLNKNGILKHYSKLSKVLVTYLLATIVILLYRCYFAHEALTFKDCILDILEYNQYSWYVNMYIGCYLLIPFMNALWNAINSRNGRLMLVVVLLILTAAPSLFNIYDFKTSGALSSPWLSTSYNVIVPDWWGGVYPITYYFIGAYLRTNVDVKKIKTWKLLLTLIIAVICFGLFNIWRSKTISFVWGAWCGWGGFQNTIDSVLTFLVINSINYPKPNKAISKAVSYISNLTFGAYILSWIPDNMDYPKLIKSISVMQRRFNYFPLLVGKTIVISLIISLGIHLFIVFTNKSISKLKRQ